MIAHVLTGNPVPLALQWLVAALLFGGILAALAARRQLLRRAAIAVAICGLLGTVSTFVIGALQPGPAPYSLRIVAPAANTSVTQHVVFTVCGVRGDGTMTPATDAQHYLVPFVDGRQVPAVDVWQVPLTLAPGPHDVRFVLVNPSSQTYNPPASVEEHIAVRTQAPESGPLACA